MEYRVYQNERGEWRWEARSVSGVLLVVGPTYPTESACRAELDQMKGKIEKYIAGQRRSADPSSP